LTQRDRSLYKTKTALTRLSRRSRSAGISGHLRPESSVILSGIRTLAVYDNLQPIQTTLFVGSPAFRPEWEGRTEEFNATLINKIGTGAVRKIDTLDPDAICRTLREYLGNVSTRRENAFVICPLGTKPQALGVFLFLREVRDTPALIYASPLRHNQNFYSYGIGSTWTLLEPS
jgi:hypothetical protein